MGVPAFYSWLTFKYRKIQTPAKEKSFDNVYVDLNGVIHPCCHNDGHSSHASEPAMFAAIANEINYLVTLTKPSKLLYLAIDGVAPRAKMVQQRSRRLRSALDTVQNKDLETEFRKYLDAYEFPSPEKRVFEESNWDSNVITPGTDFMRRLGHYLNKYVETKVRNDPDWKNLKVILSDSSVPGEGEHKILEYMRECRDMKSAEQQSHCIIGDDADLVMLSLGTHIENIQILRNTKRVETVSEERRKKNTLSIKRLTPTHLSIMDARDPTASVTEDKGYKLFNVDDCRKCFVTELKNSGVRLNSSNQQRVMDDVIVLFFLGGNDFLPNLPTLDFRASAVPVLLDAYTSILAELPGEFLIGENYQLNLEFLRRYCGILQRKVQEHAPSIDGSSRLAALDKYTSLCKSYENNTRCPHGSHCRENHGNFVPNFYTAAHLQFMLLKYCAAGGRMPKIYDDTILHPVSISTTLRNDLVIRNISIFQRNMLLKLGLSLGLQIGEGENETLRFSFRTVAQKRLPDILAKTYKTELANYIEGLERGHVAEAVRAHEKVFGKYDVSVNSKTFYTEKLGIDPDTPEGKAGISKLAVTYVHGMQFVLRYYFQGVPSWEWFYPFHYAPLAEDIATTIPEVKLEDIDFWPKSSPISPIQQLMTVLPINSVHALPKSCKEEILKPGSDVAHLYPNPMEIQLDPNGKIFRWQWTTLLPMIEPSKLLATVEKTRDSWSPQERKMDVLGKPSVYHPGQVPQAAIPKRVSRPVVKNLGAAKQMSTMAMQFIRFCK